MIFFDCDRNDERIVATPTFSAALRRSLVAVARHSRFALWGPQDDVLQIEATLLASRIHAPFEPRNVGFGVTTLDWRSGVIAIRILLHDKFEGFDTGKCFVPISRFSKKERPACLCHGSCLFLHVVTAIRKFLDPLGVGDRFYCSRVKCL
jgi:hypothetical protein